MTRAFRFPLRLSAALLALGAAMPAAAQSFSLPEPSPTPTPTPEGPADERAGVAIPPRAATPIPTPTPTPTSAPTPSPTPLPLPLPSPTPTPTPTPSPRPLPAPASSAPVAAPTARPESPVPQESVSAPVVAPQADSTGDGAAAPGFAQAEPPPVSPPEREADADEASDPLGAPAFDWRWLAAAALVASLLGAVLLWRRRQPRVLRLAAPAASGGADAPCEPPRIDLALEITGATRSLMMFTLHYRLTLANRAERAVGDLAVAVQVASAQRGASNAAPLAAARSLARIERLGPHQSRSIAGEVQMPLAAITPVMQGKVALFIPLVHVTIEGNGQQAIARSFVVGTPSGGAEGRVQPLPLDLPPGSLPGLAARPIAAPPA